MGIIGIIILAIVFIGIFITIWITLESFWEALGIIIGAIALTAIIVFALYLMLLEGWVKWS